MKINVKKWALIFLVWIALGLLYSLQSYHYRESIGRPQPWLSTLFNDLGYFMQWACVSIPIIRFITYWPIGRFNWVRRLPIHIVLAFVVSFANRGLYLVLFFSEGITYERWYNSVIGSFELDVFIYMSLLFVVHAIFYYQDLQDEKFKAAELQAQLHQAKLQALQRQLHPHFLFNTLNTISGLIESNPTLARLTIGQIGELLRMALESDDAAEITLKQEIQFVNLYLGIQQTRFGDRLVVNRSIEPNTLEAMIPTLLFLPLIENAIQYGIASVPGLNSITIACAKKDEALHLSIINECDTRTTTSTTHGFGIGLSNTRNRLEQLYAGLFNLEFQTHDSGARVDVQIPFKFIGQL